MNGRTFYILAVVFFIGVAVRTLHEIPYETLLWILFLSFVVGVLWRKNREAIFAPVFFTLGLALALFVVGALRTDVFSWQFEGSKLEATVGERVVLEGVVVREPDYRARTVHLYVETKEGLILVSADRLQGVLHGDQVTVEGKLSVPEAFTTELGRTFNYPGYLLARGVQYRISFAEVAVTDRGRGNPAVGILLDIKTKFVEVLDRAIPEPEVGLGKGLLLGIKSALGDDIETDFRRSGLTHIVVLSGYNVMLVVAFILFCLSFLLGIRARVSFGLLGIVAFALIVGLSATVVRASIMASLVLLAQVLGRRYDVMRALFLSGFLMVWINPYILLYDIGFQLSFMATLGLILLLPQFESTVVTETSRLRLKEFFLATLATQIAVLPLLWYHIGEVSIVAVLVNVLVLPIVPIAMLGTFLTGLIGFISSGAALLLGLITWVPLTVILFIAHQAAALPFATVLLPEVPAVAVLVMYAGLFFGWYYWKQKPTAAEPMADWVIEEEKSGASLDAPPQDNDDTPVFFR